MKCPNCDRSSPNQNSLICPYCGWSPAFDHSMTAAAQKIMADTAGKVDSSPVTAKDATPAPDETWDMPQSPVRPRERRAVCVRIGAHHILDMVGFGLRPRPGYVLVPEFPQLPDGCTVHDLWGDPLWHTVNFVIEHPSFEVVPDGCPAPEWRSPLEVTFRAVRIGDDNPAVMHFDTSGMTQHERDQFDNVITRMENGVEPFVVVPKKCEVRMITNEGRQTVIDFCRDLIRRLEGE